MKIIKCKRILALALALAVGVTFTPMLGGTVYATENDPAPSEDQPVDVQYSQLSTPDTITSETWTAKGMSIATETPGGFTVTLSSDGKAKIVGSVSGDTFVDLYVDSTKVKNLNSSRVNTTINMNNYSVGYHTIWISSKVYGSQNLAYVYPYVPTYPNVPVPNNSIGSYTVYSNYFDYYTLSPFYNGYLLYMDYRVKGGSWQRYGSMGYGNNSIRGLKANKNYETRSYYGKWVTYTYDGKSYLFSGLETGKGSAVVGFRTGQAKKLKIKSIKVKAVKVKKHRATYYGWYTGLPLGKYKYYTYKIKVTIKLKKKPGAKGIYINGKRLKGNKKKYTVTFGKYSSYTKPRGKKFRVYAYSFNDYSCGGYSPMYSKKKKIK